MSVYRLREDGLFSDNHALNSAFTQFNYATAGGSGCASDGCSFSRSIATMHVATNPAADETIVIGATTLTFKVAAATTTQITIGGDIATTVTNIIAAINVNKAAAACYCTAYPLSDTSRFCLVSDSPLVANDPSITEDGAKVVNDITWTRTLTQAQMAGANYFKKATTDADTKATVLAEHHYDAQYESVSGYSGTLAYQNFLY